MPNFATVSSIVHVILGKKRKGWCTENKETNSVKLKKASWHWPNLLAKKLELGHILILGQVKANNKF